MREEYDIKNLNPRKNPYANKLKKQITINIDSSIIDFFKNLSDDTGIPYQTLINLYLRDCVKNNKHLKISWVWTALAYASLKSRNILVDFLDKNTPT